MLAATPKPEHNKKHGSEQNKEGWLAGRQGKHKKVPAKHQNAVMKTNFKKKTEKILQQL